MRGLVKSAVCVCAHALGRHEDMRKRNKWDGRREKVLDAKHLFCYLPV